MSGWFHTEIPEKVEKLVADSIRKKQFTSGDETLELEKKFRDYFDVKYAIYTNSGTSSIAMSLLALGIGVGDEVIVPAVGWIATAQAVKLTGATPIIVDTIKNHTNICPSSLEKGMSEKTKAIIPVNYNGRQVNIESLKSIIPEHIQIVEDSCKSMFSKSFNQKNYSGSNGICGCFSLGMISMLPSCFGGIVITNDSEIYEKLKIIKYHGVTYNPEIYAYPSFNFKTSNLFATIALEMFKSVEDRIEKLNKVYQFYNDSLKGTQYKLLPVDVKKGEIPLLIDIYSDNFLAKDVITKLRKHDIPTLGYHPALSNSEYLKSVNTENAKSITERTFHLPCGPDQNFEIIKKGLDVLFNK